MAFTDTAGLAGGALITTVATVFAPVVWPSGMPVDDAAFLGFAGGKDLRSTERHIEVRPWKPATELPQSQAIDGMVELPTACGKHVEVIRK